MRSFRGQVAPDDDRLRRVRGTRSPDRATAGCFPVFAMRSPWVGSRVQAVALRRSQAAGPEIELIHVELQETAGFPRSSALALGRDEISVEMNEGLGHPRVTAMSRQPRIARRGCCWAAVVADAPVKEAFSDCARACASRRARIKGREAQSMAFFSMAEMGRLCSGVTGTSSASARSSRLFQPLNLRRCASIQNLLVEDRPESRIVTQSNSASGFSKLCHRKGEQSG